MASFPDHNAFDRYAWDNGRWEYDNSWKYQGNGYASYRKDEFTLNAQGYIVEFLMLLRDDTSGEAIVVYSQRGTYTEIWRGIILSTEEYSQMMAAVTAFQATLKRSTV